MSSIKLLDIEETFDIYFSRFFGLFFAKAGAQLGLTAMHITFASLAVGVIGGVMLYFQDYTLIIGIACFLITLAGVLDSADGQLARLTGTSSDFGRMVDGTIDNFVFMACYIAGGAYFLNTYGLIAIAALGMAAGYAHSVKSSIYEFYKTEYLEFFNETKESCIPLNAKGLKLQGEKWYHKAVRYIILDYTSKQLLFTSRKPAQRIQMREFALKTGSKKSIEDLINRCLPGGLSFVGPTRTAP